MTFEEEFKLFCKNTAEENFITNRILEDPNFSLVDWYKTEITRKERERCAKIIEDLFTGDEDEKNFTVFMLKIILKAIRDQG